MISMLDSLETEQNKTKIADLLFFFFFFFCVIKYIGSFLLKQEDKSTTS